MDNRLKFLYLFVSIKTLRGDGAGITLLFEQSGSLSSKVVDIGKSVSNPIFYKRSFQALLIWIIMTVKCHDTKSSCDDVRK